MQSVFSNIIGSLILSIGSIIYAKIALKEITKSTIKKDIIAILILTSVYTIVYLYSGGATRTIINFMIYIIVYKYLFKISTSKSILLTFIYAILLMIPDLITLFVAIDVIGVSKTFYYNSFAGSMLGNFTVCIIFICISLILRKYLGKILSYQLENSFINIVYSIATFLCIVVIFYSIITRFRAITNAETFIELFMITIFMVILISFFKERISKSKVISKYDKLLEFIKIYETEIENQRIANHEVKNQFLTIKSMIIDKVIKKKIIEYIDEVYGDVKKMNNQEYSKLKYLPPNGIKGLIYFKLDEANKKGLHVSVNISSKTENSVLATLGVKEFKNLGKIIGVFMDNAIEASLLSEEKVIGIEVYPTNSGVEMILSNSYKGSINKKVGTEKYSTKGKNRGHGLLLVDNIIKENSIFETRREVVNFIFIQTLLIKEK